MTILLCNMGSYVNLGDRAILIGLVRFISSNYKNINLIIQGNFAELAKCNPYDAHLLNSIRFVPITYHPFTKIFRILPFKKGKETAKTASIGEIQPTKNTLFASLTVIDLFIMQILKIRPFKRGVQDILSSNIVIMGGGTQLETAESTGIVPKFTHNLVAITLAKLFHKPTYIFGQSIGPINNYIGRFLTKNILKKLEGIYVREEESSEYLTRILKLDGKNIRTVGDCVFLLHKDPIIFNYKATIDIPKNTIGICLRNLKQMTKEQLIHIFTEFINNLTLTSNYHVVLYPQVIDENNPFHNDFAVCTELYNNLNADAKKRTAIIDSRNWSLFDSIHFLNSLQVLISMRMHPIIFRLIGKNHNHSFIAISHIHKFEGLLKQIEASDCLIPIAYLDSHILQQKLNLVIRRQNTYSDAVDRIKTNLSNSLQELLGTN